MAEASVPGVDGLVDNPLANAIATIIEQALERHGVDPADIEGTLDDAGDVLDLFAPILAEKEQERDEARADLAKLMDPELKHLRIEGGAIDLALTGPIVQHMGLVISEHFRASGAENYIEMTYHAKTEPFETYVWTIRRRIGSNSPHDLRAKAEARALAAEAALAGALEALAPFADEKNGAMQDLLWGDQPDSATMTITCPLGQVRKAREVVRAAAIRAGE